MKVTFATANPLTYLVDALRTLMLAGALNVERVGVDIAVLFVVMIGIIWVGARMYPKVVI